jgi:hypothetical protein
MLTYTVVLCTFIDGTEETVTVATPSSTSALCQLVSQLAKQTGHDATLLQVYDPLGDGDGCMTDTTPIEGVTGVVVIVDVRSCTCTFMNGGLEVVVPFDMSKRVHTQKNVLDTRYNETDSIVWQLKAGIAAQTGYDPDTLGLCGDVYPEQIHSEMRVLQCKYPAVIRVYRLWVKTPTLKMTYLLCLKHHQEKYRRHLGGAEVEVEWVRREEHKPDYTYKDVQLRVSSHFGGIGFNFDERSEIETCNGHGYFKFGVAMTLHGAIWSVAWVYDHTGKLFNRTNRSFQTSVTHGIEELDSEMYIE